MAGRRATHDVIDEHLTRWAATQDNDGAAARLLAAGSPPVGCSIRASPLRRRSTARLYETLVHPVVGEQPFVTLPFRMSSIPRWLKSPAPTLGQHNHETPGELGYSDAEIADLTADQRRQTEIVIGLQLFHC